MLSELTIDLIQSWDPESADAGEEFYPQPLRALFGGEAISPLDFSRLPLSIHHRIWILLRPEVLDDGPFVQVLCDIAGHVLPLYLAVHPEDQAPAAHLARIRAGEHPPPAAEPDRVKRAAYATHAAWNGYQAAAWQGEGKAAPAAARALRVVHAIDVALGGKGYGSGEGLEPALAPNPAGEAEQEWQLERIRGALRAGQADAGKKAT